MEFIIYRKADGQPLLQEAISSFFTEKSYDNTHNYEHVLVNIGGTKEEYDEIWLEDESTIRKTYTHEFIIQNNEIIFGAEKNQFNLDLYKDQKTNELKQLCEQTIEAGFTSANGHHYRTNRDDQINFLGKFNQLSVDASITKVLWKTEDTGYIEHSREEWLSVYSEGIAHKEQTLFKLDTLRNKVNNATAVEELDSISW